MENNPTIFLDIDGVINIITPIYSTQFDTNNISEPHLIIFLNYICERVNPNIVLTTSRRDNPEKLIEQLEKEGFLFCDNIIGETEINYKKRGEQILDYINENNIENYVVIDDEISGINGIDGKFIPIENVIHTNPMTGLTYQNVEKIINKLK